MKCLVNISKQYHQEGAVLLSREELEALRILSQTDNKNQDLKELTHIKQYPNLPIEMRLDMFWLKIGNPYRFTVHGTPVQISFSQNNKSLEQSLKNYLSTVRDYDRM